MATPATPSQSHRAAAWGAAAGVALCAVLVAYHMLLAEQGGSGGFNARVAFVSAYIAALAALAFVAAGCLMANRPAPARPLLLATASGSIFLGIAAIFSIGLALFVAAAVQLIAAGRAPAARLRDRWALVATTLGLLVLPPLALVVGFGLTS